MLVLHPSHKLKYFSKQGWNQEWIDTAEEITRDEFVRNYAAYVVPKNRKASSSVPSKKVSPSRYLFKNIIYNETTSTSKRSTVMIALTKTFKLLIRTPAPMKKILLRSWTITYLKSPRVKNIKDPLNLWYENRGLYPCLSCMARDFLMIPGKFLFIFLQGLNILNIVFRFFRCGWTCIQQGPANYFSCSQSFVSAIDALDRSLVSGAGRRLLVDAVWLRWGLSTCLQHLSTGSHDWEVTPHRSIQPPLFDDDLVVSARKTSPRSDRNKKW